MVSVRGQHEIFNILLTTLNTKGVGAERKRKAIFQWAHGQKTDVLFLQETHSTSDTENVWRKQYNGEYSVFAHGVSNARGVAILMNRGMKCEVDSILKDPDGRFILWKGKLQGTAVILANVYAPNRPQEQTRFFDKLYEDIASIMDRNYSLIIGGDFNVVFDPKRDKKGGSTLCRTQVTRLIERIMTEYGLVDIWRTKNPYKKQFTWSQTTPPIECRLDHWLIPSQWIQATKFCKIEPAVRTDHKAVLLKLQGDNFIPRGPGTWKLNNEVLQEQEYVDLITTTIQQFLTRTDIVDARKRWETLKSTVAKVSQTYCKQRARKAREREGKLLKELSQLEEELENADQQAIDQYNTLKEAVEQFYDKKVDGAIIRSRARWMAKGEKNNKYFLSLEKRNFNSQTINQIDNGSERITDPQQILNTIRQHYTKLFQSMHPQVLAADFQYFFQDELIPKLTEEEVEALEAEITIEECTSALENMQEGKTPGSDGLTVEFYKKFWNLLKDLLFQCYTLSGQEAHLPASLSRGIIRLLPKPNKNPLLIQNWRPITLLNVDYKILSAALAKRMKTVLMSLIHEDQTGFMKSRYIGESIRLLLDLFEHLEKTETGALAISLDIEKAFDSLEWPFLQKALHMFGFGPNFRKWVSTLTNNAHSSVINNGYLTNYFTLERSCRQGDPIAPLLFILAIELLSIVIRSRNDIQGVQMRQFEYKLVQYADDTTVIVSDVNSVQILAQILADFGKCSGLKVNASKTTAVGVGSWKNRQMQIPFNVTDSPGVLSVRPQTVRILGIQFTTEKRDMIAANIEPKVQQMKSTLTGWHSRGLTLQGRILTLKALGLSQLTYPIMNLTVPRSVLKNIDQYNFAYIWKGAKKAKIKRSVLIQDYDRGGLKAPCLFSMNKAWKLKWLNRILGNPNAKWCQFGVQLLTKVGGLEYLLLCNFNTKLLPLNLNEFYEELLERWTEINPGSNPQNGSEVCEQRLCNNRHVLIAHKSFYCDALVQHRLDKLRAWFRADGRVWTYADLTRQYGPVIRQFLFNQIVAAIPQAWKRMAATYHADPPLQTSIISDPVKAKKILLLKQFSAPSAIQKWQNSMGLNLDEWQKLCLSSRKQIKEARLYVFQYKILHRILPTAALLHKYRLLPSPECTRCHQQIDTIEHYFCDCSGVQDLWRSIKTLIAEKEEVNISLTQHLKLFGYSQKTPATYKLNFVLLHARYFIYLSKSSQDENISPLAFSNFLKFRLKVLVSCGTKTDRETQSLLWSKWLE